VTGVHRLTPPDITALAPASPALAGLGAARLSRHLLQIRALADQVGARAAEDGELAGFAGSLAALATMQRSAEDEIAGLLGAPDTGAWSAWCLRRLLGAVSDEVRFPLDLAHLGALALTAAVVTGIAAEVVVPIRDGWLVLPSLGRLRVDPPATWRLATARRDGTGLTVDRPGGGIHLRVDGGRPGGAGWEPMHRLRLDAERPAGLLIDDITPYRRLYGYPPGDRLRPAELERWRELIDGAWKRLCRDHPPWAAAFGQVISVLAPLAPRGPVVGVSATARDGVGAIALTPPADSRALALTFVHELQHNYVNALHNVSPLFRDGTTDRLYSPWRDDPRPLAGVLHGTAAFLGVADFWRREPAGPDRLAELEYALTVIQVRTGHRTLTASPGGLTAAGRSLTGSIGATLAGMDVRPVGAVIRRLARDLAREHRAAWRIAHEPPAAPEVLALLDGGTPVAAPAAPRAGEPDQPAVPSRLRRLAERWLALPGGPGIAAAARPQDVPMDVATLAGDYRAAARGYARRLVHEPDDLRSLTGLLVSARHTPSPPPAPEVLALALRSADERGRAAILARWTTG
jgi:HEXXH motif-containing protein